MKFILFPLTLTLSLSLNPLNTLPQRFCKNCKFFIQQKGLPESFGKCGLFPKIEEEFFLVTGIMEQKTDYNYCSTARYIETMCGEKGKHYQEK